MTDICRLCLSKNFVNHSIFGDDSGLFYKIDACLPLKISESDNLPKKICDKCTLKINDIHEYCTNAVNAEKHLLLTVFQITNTNTFINNDEKALLLSPFNARAQKKPNEPRNDPSNWSVKKHTSPISPEYSISIVDHGIKEEPSDSYEVVNSENNKDPALNKEVSSSNSYSTKCTQTELCLSDVIKESILTQNKELFIDTDKVIKEEEVFFNESPVENDFNFESVDNNQYSSDDDVTLNKIIKVVPPIKVKLNKTHPDSSKVKHKKSKKRKKELKEPEVIAKRSRGRPKGSLNKKIDGKEKEKPKSKKRSRKSIYDECGIKLDIKVEGINVLEKVGGVKDDGDKWFYPKGTAEDEKKWQCLTCFAFKSSRTDLLQHYKDHVTYDAENEDKLMQNNHLEPAQTTLTNEDDEFRLLSPAESRKWAKFQRAQGKEYIGYKVSENKMITQNTIRPAKCIKERCTHKTPKRYTIDSYLCHILSEADRIIIFNTFWNLGSWELKKSFVASLVQRRPIRRRRQSSLQDKPVKKLEAHDYFLKGIDGNYLRVCRFMFLNTLSLGEHCLKLWVKEKCNRVAKSNEASIQTCLMENQIICLRR